MKSKTKKSFRLVAIMAVATGLIGFSALPSSSAAGRDGVCATGEFCYYYNSNNKGSVSDFTGSLSNYGNKQPSCYEFKGKGAGKGLCVKNNAASVWNRSKKTVRVYFNSYFGGTYQDFKPGAKGNLKAALKNNNASHEFAPSAKGTTFTPVNDYPFRNNNNKNPVDDWLFYKGQCTSFAAWRINHTLKIDFDNYYGGVRWGNAYQWYSAALSSGARAKGVTVSTTPRAGDIAVRTYSGNGHVAFVTKVYAKDHYVVEEYNHVARNTYSVRTVTSKSASNDKFNQFIHFVK